MFLTSHIQQGDVPWTWASDYDVPARVMFLILTRQCSCEADVPGLVTSVLQTWLECSASKLVTCCLSSFSCSGTFNHSFEEHYGLTTSIPQHFLLPSPVIRSPSLQGRGLVSIYSLLRCMMEHWLKTSHYTSTGLFVLQINPSVSLKLLAFPLFPGIMPCLEHNSPGLISWNIMTLNAYYLWNDLDLALKMFCPLLSVPLLQG